MPQIKRVAVGDKVVEVSTPFPLPADWYDQAICCLLVDRSSHGEATIVVPREITQLSWGYGRFRRGALRTGSPCPGCG